MKEKQQIRTLRKRKATHKSFYKLQLSYSPDFMRDMNNFLSLISMDERFDNVKLAPSQRASYVLRMLIKQYNTQRFAMLEKRKKDKQDVLSNQEQELLEREEKLKDEIKKIENREGA